MSQGATLPTATTSYLLERIESALADAEYARLIGDTDRSTQAMVDAKNLARSLRRFTLTRLHGAPVVVHGLARQR